jgi:hypothetical protein
VLPPSKLYWRLRIVFALYGNKVNPKDGKPLFNDAAWKKANNVLQEVLAGHCSDPPGFDFYHQKLDAHGAPATNSLGLALLECWRGTSLTECAHKQIEHTFGSWHTGVEMSDALLAWWRHCYIQHISERRRLGFPKIGHSHTWLIDKVQLLVEQNHGTLAYPHWSNESDYARTAEKFGTVPLHTEQLGAAVQAIEDVKLVDMDLTRNEKYIAKAMGVKVPFLPVHGKDEKKLFCDLVTGSTTAALDFDQMALDWCGHVNGKTIFPKLPAYLRTYETTWKRNQAARAAMRVAKPANDILKQLMKKTGHAPPATAAPAPDAAGGAAGAAAGAPPAPAPAPAPIAQYGPMAQPAVPVVPEEGVRVVGGTATSGTAAADGGGGEEKEKRGHGKRGKGRSTYTPRLCKRCGKYKDKVVNHGEGKCEQ